MKTDMHKFIREHLIEKLNNVMYKKTTYELLPLSKNITKKDLKKIYKVYSYEKNIKNLVEDILNTFNSIKEYHNTSAKRMSKEYQYMVFNIISNISGEYEDFNSKYINDVIDVLRQEDKKSYAVGGFIRDSCLNRKPKDIDFCTEISYDRLKKIFTKNNFAVKEVGKEFLVMVVSKGGEQFEIAVLRKDGTYKDGRRPESVCIGTIEEDASRRDFTINALYLDIKTGELLDPTGQGIIDIINKNLRFIGKPINRIKEDYLRVFRFYRFLATYNELKPDKKSMKAVRTYFNEAYKNTTPERVRVELEKIIGYKNE